MEILTSQVSALKEAVSRSVAKYSSLLNDLEQLRESNQQLTVQNERLQLEIGALREELKTVKLAQALTGQNDQDPREIKLQINSYLREIDKCLALLNRD